MFAPAKSSSNSSVTFILNSLAPEASIDKHLRQLKPISVSEESYKKILKRFDKQKSEKYRELILIRFTIGLILSLPILFYFSLKNINLVGISNSTFNSSQYFNLLNEGTNMFVKIFSVAKWQYFSSIEYILYGTLLFGFTILVLSDLELITLEL